MGTLPESLCPKFDKHHTILAEEASRYPRPQRSWPEDGHHGGRTIMLLMVIVLLTLRRKDSRRARSFRVPLYPFTPILFATTCVGLLWSSTLYVEPRAIGGVGGFRLGAPLLLLRSRGREEDGV